MRTPTGGGTLSTPPPAAAGAAHAAASSEQEAFSPFDGLGLFEEETEQLGDDEARRQSLSGISAAAAVNVPPELLLRQPGQDGSLVRKRLQSPKYSIDDEASGHVLALLHQQRVRQTLISILAAAHLRVQ